MNTENDLSTDNGEEKPDQPARSTEDLLRRTAAYGGAEIEAGRDRLKRQWESAESRAVDWRDAADQNLRRLARVTDECAHRHPWESIAVAALAGALFTACWLKRSR